ncbi:hypothetical protein H0E87_014363 [Populus deltoides]|uniref:Uncharacterized protein n=1 Tax=Populus deltoides TaxID=3696 RepID=A0A8T2YD69_POPDE|nr:hypothetical protein H0E87_014363 [Populus deltoides]
MAMTVKIMDGNFRDGHMELAEVNRMALSSAFARTLSLLYQSVQNPQGSDDSSSTWQLEKQRPRSAGFEEADDVVAEKLAQELLCITNKLRDYGAVDEALLQWSYASFLASLALSTANPRVQGYIAKISGICFHS